MHVVMRRVDIIAPTSLAARVMRSVHRAGVVHLTPFEPSSGAVRSMFHVEVHGAATGQGSARRLDAAADYLARLAGLLGNASTEGTSPALVRAIWELSEEALLAEVDGLQAIADEAAEASATSLRLRGEADRLAGYRRIVEGLRRAIGHLPAVRGYGSTGIVVRARYRPVVWLIREELEALTDGRCEVLAADMDAERVAAVLIYPIRLAGEVRSMLGGRDLEEVTLPESLAAVPFDELVPRLAQEESISRAGAADAEARLQRLADAHRPRVAALRAVVGDRIAEDHVLAEAGRSDHLTVVGGWLPAGRVEALRKRLAREVGPEVLVVERAVTGEDRGVPVALDDRPVLRAFEPLASFVALPRYGTVDPTPALAFAFPVFVGLMVGDAGYGLVLLFLLALARRRWAGSPAMDLVWPIGALAATSTIVFGLLFGEVFGNVGSALLGLRPLWIDRREAVVPLLAVAISLGVAQITLGLVLGVVNATRLHHRREAWGRVALLTGLVGVVAGLAALAGVAPAWVGALASAALAAALVVMTATLGLAGPIEMMGMVGNVLSYARLMAIGLASMMLALIANRMGGLTEDVLIGLVIAIAFHVLAFVLGFFDASVQGLRLHYVEFFSKFVEPGGTRYRPFAAVIDDRDRGPVPARAGGT